MTAYKTINIDNIVVPKERLWQIKSEQVDNLKDSIKEVGLMNPITVQKRSGKYVLIGGEHRYTACKQLGFKTIDCTVIPRKYDTDEKEDARLVLMEVDENLVRRTADFIEESFLLNRRKIAYEKINPNSTGIDKVKLAVKNRNKTIDNNLTQDFLQGSEIKTFIDDTVEKTGLSKQTIAKKVHLGSLLPEERKDDIKKNKINKISLEHMVAGKNKEEVKKAIDIHLDTITGMKTDKNKNTVFQKAVREVKKEVTQSENPIAFAEKVQEVIPKIIEKEEQPKPKRTNFRLSEDDLYEINELINTIPDADALVVLVNGVEIYSKTKK